MLSLSPKSPFNLHVFLSFSPYSSGSEAGEPAAKVSPEAPVVIPGERQSTRLRDRKDHPSTTSITGIAESAKNLKEQRNSLESQNASNARYIIMSKD